MKKILVVTGTRAEYGLLYWTMKKIEQDRELKLQLIVTGNHLSPEYGLTINQIKEDGFYINEKVDMIISSENKSSVVKSMGLELIQMASAMERLSPDLLLILGDRYEIFIAATCAMMMNIPIAHINGGESTEGAIDEQIRHAITKMAHVHFPGAEYYKECIIKMGEEPWRVHNVGQCGIENMKKLSLFNKEDIGKMLHIDISKKIFLITYHPATLDLENIETQMDNLLSALKKFNAEFIFTYPNADFGNKVIVDKLNEFKNKNKNVHLFYSLGQLRYLSIMKNCDVIIGNSSSGILEAPYFKVPVVNIGDRQKGRLRSNNILDVSYNEKDIVDGINKALYDKEFNDKCKCQKNIYGEGNTSDNIVYILRKLDIDKKLLSKKLSY